MLGPASALGVCSLLDPSSVGVLVTVRVRDPADSPVSLGRVARYDMLDAGCARGGMRLRG